MEVKERVRSKEPTPVGLWLGLLLSLTTSHPQTYNNVCIYSSYFWRSSYGIEVPKNLYTEHRTHLTEITAKGCVGVTTEQNFPIILCSVLKPGTSKTNKHPRRRTCPRCPSPTYCFGRYRARRWTCYSWRLYLLGRESIPVGRWCGWSRGNRRKMGKGYV